VVMTADNNYHSRVRIMSVFLANGNGESMEYFPYSVFDSAAGGWQSIHLKRLVLKELCHYSDTIR